jgi:hypothetical protein
MMFVVCYSTSTIASSILGDYRCTITPAAAPPATPMLQTSETTVFATISDTPASQPQSIVNLVTPVRTATATTAANNNNSTNKLQPPPTTTTQRRRGHRYRPSFDEDIVCFSNI